MRDSQKGKVYSSENELFPLSKSKKMSEPKVREFLYRLRGGAMYQKALGYSPIRLKVVNRKNQCASWCLRTRTLTLPPWAMTKDVILHEVAHVLCDEIEGSGKVADHGPEFCSILLNLIAMYWSKKKAEELEEVYTKYGVQYIRRRLVF